MTTYRVMDYDTGSSLRGAPSAELVERSAEADPTGAVPAYRDEAGVWQYVQPSMVEQYERTQRLDIITVYIEAP